MHIEIGRTWKASYRNEENVDNSVQRHKELGKTPYRDIENMENSIHRQGEHG